MDKEDLTEHEQIVIRTMATEATLDALISKLIEKGLLTKDDRIEMMCSIKKSVLDALL